VSGFSNGICFADNAFGTLASGLLVTDTSLTFTTGHGARFPAIATGQALYCVLLNSTNVLEEIKITAHVDGADTATIVRAAGGTTAKAWSVGDRIESRLSSEMLLAAIVTPPTGTGRLTLQTTPASTWIMADDGTIGDASSGATTRANADTSALYSLLWTNVSDTYAPVTGGRGASAAADFAAHKKIALTRVLGRALAIAGSGSALTARTLGQYLGEETHLQDATELVSHTHTASVTDPTHIHSVAFALNSGVAGGVPNVPTTNNANATTPTAAASTGISVSNSSTGGGVAFNVMQPTSLWNLEIKL
jgi:microcystin-dependent protein